MIPTLTFGRCGYESTRAIFGAAALCGGDAGGGRRARSTLLLEHGVNHIDTAALLRRLGAALGAWMARHRDRFFLATKTGSATTRTARDQIRRSLERLRVDRIDLIQLHNLVEETSGSARSGRAARSRPLSRRATRGSCASSA